MRLAAFAFVLLVATATHGAEKDADYCADLSEKGQLLKIKGKLREARETFLECVKDKCPPLVRKDCGQFLVDLESAMPTIVVAARDPSGGDLTDVRVIIDGEVLTTRLEGKALPMDPGVHKFRFESKGRVSIDQTIVVREGERNRVIGVTLAPIADEKPLPVVVEPPGPPVAAWVAAGIGFIGFGTFAAFGLSARAEFNDLEKRCGSRCPESDVDRVRGRALVADIGLVVGVIGAGAATYFFIDHAKKSSVQLGAGWIGVTASF